MTSLGVRNMTRRAVPRLPFVKIAAAALRGWDISLVFLTPENARAMNKALRKKAYTPNVLSYESGTKSGEVAICLAVAKQQAPSYGMTYRTFVAYLFIHGLLHLKGQRHGPTMEGQERRLMSRFVTLHHNASTHRDRNRRGVPPDESRGGRRGVGRKKRG